MQTETQIQNTDSNANHIANPSINPTAKRLARMPHVIALPAETPDPPELKRLIEARIAELKSEQLRLDRRDEDQAFEFGANKSILAILELHLAELHHDFPDEETLQGRAGCPQPAAERSDVSLKPEAPTRTETDTNPIVPIPPIGPSRPLGPIHSPPPTQLTKENNSELTEPSEPAIQPQQHPSEPEVSRSEPGSVPTEPIEPTHSADLNLDLDQQFAEALKKIPEGFHEIAADLYESIHRRSKFAKLTSTQRHAIFELNKTWNTQSVLEIIAMPPPIGIGLRTSLAGLKRFLQDYRRILQNQQDIETNCQTEEERLAAEQFFETANTSDETFRQATERQIRKRLFVTANNPNSDYHEIRWLLKSLEHLRKPQP